MTTGSGAGPGLVGIAKVLGWMVANISGFMEITMRPVKPSPRFDLIEERFPLCSLYWSVMLARLGSPTILLMTGCGKTAKSWSELSGIGQSQAIGFIGLGRLVRGKISGGKKTTKQGRFGGYDGSGRESTSCRYRGLFWDGAER